MRVVSPVVPRPSGPVPRSGDISETVNNFGVGVHGTGISEASGIARNGDIAKCGVPVRAVWARLEGPRDGKYITCLEA